MRCVSLASLGLLCAWTVQAGTYTVRADQIYARRPDGPLPADVYIPAGAGPFPGVIVIHGGGWMQGGRQHMSGIARMLAQNGYAAINITYRLAPAHTFPAQLHDCKAAVRWARVHAHEFRLDPERIGAYGYSAGAHLALLLGTTGPEARLEGPRSAISSRVQAVVAGAGPSDLRGHDHHRRVRQLMGGPEPGREALYAAASPLTHVTHDDAPTLLYHGRHDTVVRFAHSQNMLKALVAVGVPVKLFELPFGHVLSFLAGGAARAAAIAFFDSYLKAPAPGMPPRPAPPSSPARRGPPR